MYYKLLGVSTYIQVQVTGHQVTLTIAAILIVEINFFLNNLWYVLKNHTAKPCPPKMSCGFHRDVQY